MFSEFAVKRRGDDLWEVHIVNDNFTRDTIVSTSECAVYLDKATELVEDLAGNVYKQVCKELG